jgi:hypothetical protein
MRRLQTPVTAQRDHCDAHNLHRVIGAVPVLQACQRDRPAAVCLPWNTKPSLLAASSSIQHVAAADVALDLLQTSICHYAKSNESYMPSIPVFDFLCQAAPLFDVSIIPCDAVTQPASIPFR